jgi:hypothetical protein
MEGVKEAEFPANLCENLISTRLWVDKGKKKGDGDECPHYIALLLSHQDISTD